MVANADAGVTVDESNIAALLVENTADGIRGTDPPGARDLKTAITDDAILDAANTVDGVTVTVAGSRFSDGRLGTAFSGVRGSKDFNTSDIVIVAADVGSDVAVIGLDVNSRAISADLEGSECRGDVIMRGCPGQSWVSLTKMENGYASRSSNPFEDVNGGRFMGSHVFGNASVTENFRRDGDQTTAMFGIAGTFVGYISFRSVRPSCADWALR